MLGRKSPRSTAGRKHGGRSDVAKLMHRRSRSMDAGLFEEECDSQPGRSARADLERIYTGKAELPFSENFFDTTDGTGANKQADGVDPMDVDFDDDDTATAPERDYSLLGVNLTNPGDFTPAANSLSPTLSPMRLLATSKDTAEQNTRRRQLQPLILPGPATVSYTHLTLPTKA